MSNNTKLYSALTDVRKTPDFWTNYDDVAPIKLFFYLWKEIPDSYYNRNKIDLEKINKYIEENYSNNEWYYRINRIEDRQVISYDPDDDDYNYNGKVYPVNNNAFDDILIILDENLIINYREEGYNLYYKKQENIDELIKIFNSFLISIDEPKFFIVSRESGGGLYLTSHTPDTKIVNVEKYYNDEFLPINENIISFINNDESGLVILHGLHGTGKTSYIRHLIGKTKKKIIYLSTDMMQHLSSPELIPFMLKQKDSIIILEDCEEILQSRNNSGRVNSGLINILNMSDGLLGDALKLKFICTFNEPLKTIDQALMRKGRLIARYEFKPLCADKVRTLNQEQNLSIPDDEIKDMTLAEIYNFDKLDYKQDKCKPIGLKK